MTKPTKQLQTVSWMDAPLDLTNADDRAKLAELRTAAIRMRSVGAMMGTIADKLALGSDAEAEFLVSSGLREIMADDAESIRARQQFTLNEVKKAMYPAMQNGDTDSAGVVLKVLDHEAKLHGILAPTRVHHGLDQESFTTTVDDDVRALGVDPRMDTPLVVDAAGDEETWANT